MSVPINIFLVVPYEQLISDHIKHVSSLIPCTSQRAMAVLFSLFAVARGCFSQFLMRTREFYRRHDVLKHSWDQSIICLHNPFQRNKKWLAETSIIIAIVPTGLWFEQVCSSQHLCYRHFCDLLRRMCYYFSLNRLDYYLWFSFGRQ